jgi:hypothetical protein
MAVGQQAGSNAANPDLLESLPACPSLGWNHNEHLLGQYSASPVSANTTSWKVTDAIRDESSAIRKPSQKAWISVQLPIGSLQSTALGIHQFCCRSKQLDAHEWSNALTGEVELYPRGVSTDVCDYPTTCLGSRRCFG